MLRTTVDKAHIKRTIRPLYGWTQQTPSDMKLDAGFDRSVDIYPGMVATKTAGRNVTLIGEAGNGTPADELPFGLFGLYIGGDGIDEVADQGVNSVAVWVFGGPDAESEILAPAFDTAQTWTSAADGSEVLVHAWVSGADQGKLAPAGSVKAGHVLSAQPVCRLIEVPSASKIVVGGLR